MFENDVQQDLFVRLVRGGLPEVYAVIAAQRATGHNPYSTGPALLASAFLWAASPEGYDFWWGVHSDWRHHLQHMEWL